MVAGLKHEQATGNDESAAHAASVDVRAESGAPAQAVVEVAHVVYPVPRPLGANRALFAVPGLRSRRA